jgi:hypothetical protein
MKFAIEHLQQTIAVTERALSSGRDAVKAAQRQLDEHASGVARNEKLLADLNAALAVLRAPSNEAPPAAIVDQIKKTELADRPTPRATLSRKGN